MSAAILIEGNEDCLFLNIYSKSLRADIKIPVMVYIHGGAFMSGSGDASSYGPEFLLQHDVILVTMNYRLEVLGFLCLDTPEAPGNAGMKDQVAALRWIKENIAKFGGDPDNITIFGESSGSHAVTYHMLSPMSKGLFNKVIGQSGVCIQDWGLSTGAVERAFRVGKLLGKETNDVNELLSFLITVPALKLAKMTLLIKTEVDEHVGLPKYFFPVVEKQFQNVEPFLVEDTLDILLSGKANKVPFMIGYNSAEGLLMLQDQLNKTNIVNSQSSLLVPNEVARRVSKEKLKEFGKRIKRYYVGERDLSHETKQEIVNMQTDINFAYNTHRFIKFYSGLNAPIYMFRFDYVTALNVVKNIIGFKEIAGACHADDLFYLFYNVLNRDAYNGDENLRRIVFNLTKKWTDFAKTG